jgi:tetratricopeptide (TPR) repeat protein
MDQDQPVSDTSPQSDSPSQAGTVEPGSEAAELKEQASRGNLAGLREFLARTRMEFDWQDRVFMLGLIVPSIRLAALDFACDAEPEAADLHLIRCAFFTGLAATMRGSKTTDKVPEGKFRSAAECIQAALLALEKAAQLDAQDPTAFAFILPSLTIFGQLQPHQQHAFRRATELVPDLVPAYYAIVFALSQRWYGSHEKCLQFARHAMTKAGPGSDMAVCLFQAHMLVRSHLSSFDKKPEAAAAYLHNPEAKKELEAAFDSWTQPPYTPKRSSIQYLNCATYWFYLLEDSVRLDRAMSLTGKGFSKNPWSWAGDAETVYSRALQIAAGRTPPPLPGKNDPWELCTAAIALSAEAVKSNKLGEAEKALTVALAYAKTAPPEQSAHLVPLALLNVSYLRQKQGRNEESQKLRDQAKDLIDSNNAPLPSAKLQSQTAQILNQLGEYRLALRFWEEAISLTPEEADPTKMAGMLHRMGECYNQMGLQDHAVLPLRAALKIYRTCPEDPRLAGILLALGSSLRKSSPTEAEAFYKEAAELHSAQLRVQSATPAWVNLGILCSEQGRHSESLDYYQRVLRVREESRGTPPARIAGVHNNIANCLRRMGKFSEAHASVKRAIQIYPAGDAGLASAYGTRGMIFLDSGDNAEAVEWLRKASAERRKQPSPDFSAAIDDLECEILALKKMGRTEEALTVQAALDSARSTMLAIPKADIDPELSTSRAQMEGAVLVELAIGNKPVRSDGRKYLNALTGRLSKEVKTQDVGHYSGRVAIPESTTLFFYGPDAEILFKVLDPSLKSNEMCLGARVIVRQGNTYREMIMPRRSESLN